MHKNPRQQLRKQFEFRWDTLDIVIGGKSSIDALQGFNIHTPDDAERFLRSYGFDPQNPIEGAEVIGHYHEALNFIRRHFLQPDNPDGLRIEIPRRIVELHRIQDLFLMASSSFPGQHQDANGVFLKNWACALLKVMHTIAHVDQDLRSNYFSQIQTQILDRFYRHIHRDPEGALFLGESNEDLHRVDLVAFETKPKKSRESTLVKLLHKPENVAEDIFDRVGIRFVTKTALGSIRVVKFLTDHMIVMPPNLKPSRSRNSLVDLHQFRDRLETILARFDANEMDEENFRTEVYAAAEAPSVNPDNPHTSEFYRAIQFTCRQLIKLKNPLFDDIRELKHLSKSQGLTPEITKLMERIDLKFLQKEVRFFYPYEVQVLDVKSHEENERGRSAHSEYKRSQLQTAMRRVMGSLADASR